MMSTMKPLEEGMRPYSLTYWIPNWYRCHFWPTEGGVYLVVRKSIGSRPINDLVPRRPIPLLCFLIVFPPELRSLKFRITKFSAVKSCNNYSKYVCVCGASAVYDPLKINVRLSQICHFYDVLCWMYSLNRTKCVTEENVDIWQRNNGKNLNW